MPSHFLCCYSIAKTLYEQLLTNDAKVCRIFIRQLSHSHNQVLTTQPWRSQLCLVRVIVEMLCLMPHETLPLMKTPLVHSITAAARQEAYGQELQRYSLNVYAIVKSNYHSLVTTVRLPSHYNYTRYRHCQVSSSRFTICLTLTFAVKSSNYVHRYHCQDM